MTEALRHRQQPSHTRRRTAFLQGCPEVVHQLHWAGHDSTYVSARTAYNVLMGGGERERALGKPKRVERLIFEMDRMTEHGFAWLL
jgi:hypothetical protein